MTILPRTTIGHGVELVSRARNINGLSQRRLMAASLRPIFESTMASLLLSQPGSVTYLPADNPKLTSCMAPVTDWRHVSGPLLINVGAILELTGIPELPAPLYVLLEL